MATIRKTLVTSATPAAVWDRIRDVGALHTRLVPGFVVATQPTPGGRIVTFGNGMVVTEPIVSIEEQERRLVWTSRGTTLTHYNASVQVFEEEAGSRVVWTADLLPDEAVTTVAAMMTAGMEAMQQTLDASNLPPA